MHNKFYTQVQVQSPCQQPWSEMTPEQQGRFCNACARTVIDFTNCTDEELFAFFSTDRKERVCGRFLPEQLDRPLQSTPTSTRSIWGWVRAVASLILPMLLQSKADAQQALIPAYNPPGDTGKVRVVKRPPVLGIAIRNRIQPEDTPKPTRTDVDIQQTPVTRKEGELDKPSQSKTGTTH